MKITIERDRILKPLGSVSSVVERRQTLPMLGNVYIRYEHSTVTLIGTDLETEVKTKVNDVEGEFGECTVGARKLHDICRALEENSNIEMQLRDERLMVNSGSSRFNLQTLPAMEFPRIETEDWDCELEVSQGELKKLIEKTAFSMAQQDVRYYLNGLLMEITGKILRVVATDGHRLAKSEITLDRSAGKTTRQAIIPRKAVNELGRYLEASDQLAKLCLSTNHLQVEVGLLVFTTKLIDGRFPDYEKVIPKDLAIHLQVHRNEMFDILARASILTNEKFRGIRLGVKSNKLSVMANNPEQEEAEDSMSIDYEGDEIEVGFNVNYLMEALRALEGETVDLGVQDPNSSCTIQQPNDNSTIYLVMPMRL